MDRLVKRRTGLGLLALPVACLVASCAPTSPEVELPREWGDELTGVSIVLRPDGTGTVVDLPLGDGSEDCESGDLEHFSGDIEWAGVGEFEYAVTINGRQRSLWVDVERLGSANPEEVTFLPCEGVADWRSAVTLYG
ncbi:hypothetical protein [Cellulomonas sp. SLBN-39]|uniref:hypothetical protein n=1 Tax=Cellulomonas sp. SLBN-39 TaxID=2768446 RepID=UPI00115406AD|nr:hypothetical protein [Cellulomonas sp. SLBN-39]